MPFTYAELVAPDTSKSSVESCPPHWQLVGQDVTGLGVGLAVGLAVGLGVGLGVGPEESLLAELLYLDVYR